MKRPIVPADPSELPDWPPKARIQEWHVFFGALLIGVVIFVLAMIL